MSTRLRLFSSLLLTGALAGSAYAGPHRIVVLDFDGPRALADTGHDAVVRVLGRSNDLVSQQTWLDAKATVARTSHGPNAWASTSKKINVDAVIEGWVQDEGRTKVLTVVVTDATDGHELDQLTIKLGTTGTFSDAAQKTLRDGLADRLEWLPPFTETLDPKHAGKTLDPKQGGIGTETAPAPSPTAPAQIGPQLPPPETDKPDKPVDAKPKDIAAADGNSITILEGQPGKTDWLPEPTKHVSHDTPKIRVDAGATIGSRTLWVGAENQDNVTQYSGVSDKQIGVSAAIYPFPWRKKDGVLSGPGVSFAVDQSVGSTVTFDDLDTVGDYSINRHGWNGAFHYRAPLGSYFTIDGEVGYGSQTYLIEDAPATFEVPDTSYHYLHAGGHLDMAITDRASVGFGGKYFHVLDSGDLSSVDWYGPGRTSGFALDGNFVVPLPARMYVRGELSYTRFKTTFDGVGEITEAEGVYEAVDSTVAGSVKIGIQF